MIILDTTTRTLEVLLAGSVTTSQLPVTASYVDFTTTATTPIASNTATNNTTAVTLVSAPGASTQRQVKVLSIYNADTVSATVTVRLNDNGTTRIMIKATLATGDTLHYSDTRGWYTVAAMDATLVALAALDSTPGFLVQTAADTFTKRNVTSTSGLGITVTNPAGTAGNALVDMDINAMTATDVADTDTFPLYDASATAVRKVSYTRLLGFASRGTVQGRLTLESGVPISTTDQASKTTIYFTPYNGNLISLYDGTRWNLYTFTERSLALGTLTTDKNYDVFIYDNSGTLTLELSAAWSSDTARTDALTTQDGVYVKSGATTRLYLGTIRTTSTTVTQDTQRLRFVWNLYNQVNRTLSRFDSTASWTYGTATIRYLNNSATNRVEVLQGITGVSLVECYSTVICDIDNDFYILGVGENTSTVLSSQSPTRYFMSLQAGQQDLKATLITNPRLGYSFYAAVETVILGTSSLSGGGPGGTNNAGIFGWYDC